VRNRIHSIYSSVQSYYSRVKDAVALILYELQLLRLRIEYLKSKKFSKKANHRVMAIACWDFPIYSHTFVYQELTQLIKADFELRFIYSKCNSREHFPVGLNLLWRARRKLIEHPKIAQRTFLHFKKTMPEKVNALIDFLMSASDMSFDELCNHHSFLNAFSFVRMVQIYQPDYLHSYFFYDRSLFTLIASYLLDIPRGVSCYADHLLKDYELKLTRQHLEQCSLVIATSKRIKQELIEIAPQVDSDRILVKPNAIDPKQFPILKLKQPEDGMPFGLVCVSRIEPKKGLIYLVEAVKLLRNRNLNVECHFIGGIDDSDLSRTYADQLNKQIKELELESFVHLEGVQSQVKLKELFKKFDLFVAPFLETDYGDKDGISTAILEAMASGFPVVSSNSGSICEVIDDGHDGVIVPQRDSHALSSAIADLMSDLNRRRFLGKNAVNKIQQKFSVNVCDPIFHARLKNLLKLKR